MRTLLVDNYDSYTYNLFQLIAEVNGAPPTVVTNDAVSGVDLSTFDNVVISPGPGHPDRPGDFGGCTALLATTALPVLGVCLGHQGIAAGEGGVVDSAPEPRHGYVSRVRHDGTGLFAGIPQDFEVVRYHSLALHDPVPPALEVTARAEDGVAMGLRHRSRPQWGVQFHPESVSTRFGRELIANFARLTREHHGGHRAVPGGPARGHYVAHTAVLGRPVDAEAAFVHLSGDRPDAFWLDSSHVEPGRSRFSFHGDASGPLAETVTYDRGGRVRVRRGGVEHVEPDTVLEYLQRELSRRHTPADPTLPFDFQGGYVGWFGYEMKDDLGGSGRHRSDTPDACWVFVDRFVAHDHEAGRTYVVALGDGTEESARAARRWCDETSTRLDGLVAPAPTGPRRRPRPVPTADVEPALRTGRDAYLDDIDQCRRQLTAGESYEICLTNMVTVPAHDDGLSVYRRLRRRNPAPYAAFLRLGGVEVACSSPERFLKIGRDRTVEAKPIKGTAPRGATADEDERLRDELGASAKTRAENLMIVDLLRNDLGRICDVGSVHVPSLMAVESYATVHQLVSTVRGQLREDVDVIDTVRASFPGGSMTGAPKRRTMEIIDGLEPGPRGIYSGAIGFLATNGTADLNIVIRTGVLVDGRWRVGAGGAIVLDSDSVEEFDEMVLKASAWLGAHPPARTDAGREHDGLPAPAGEVMAR